MATFNRLRRYPKGSRRKSLRKHPGNMDIDERRKFDIQYQVLEDKTIKSMKNK